MSHLEIHQPTCVFPHVPHLLPFSVSSPIINVSLRVLGQHTKTQLIGNARLSVQPASSSQYGPPMNVLISARVHLIHLETILQTSVLRPVEVAYLPIRSQDCVWVAAPHTMSITVDASGTVLMDIIQMAPTIVCSQRTVELTMHKTALALVKQLALKDLGMTSHTIVSLSVHQASTVMLTCAELHVILLQLMPLMSGTYVCRHVHQAAMLQAWNACLVVHRPTLLTTFPTVVSRSVQQPPTTPMEMKSTTNVLKSALMTTTEIRVSSARMCVIHDLVTTSREIVKLPVVMDGGVTLSPGCVSSHAARLAGLAT